MVYFLVIDGHCHLSDSRIFHFAPEMIKRALTAGVSRIALGGVEPEEWKRQIELKQKYPQLIITHFGIHPWIIDEKFHDQELIQNYFEIMEKMIDQANGIGETGLDFGKKRNPESVAIQEKYFRKQMELALKTKKPVVLHLVNSHDRALEMIKGIRADPLRFVLHRYSGSKEQMQQYLEMGALISFSGEISAEKGHLRAKEAFMEVPLERLLIESDAPDQGKEPAEVSDFYRVAAKIRGISVEKLKERVAENFAQVY